MITRTDFSKKTASSNKKHSSNQSSRQNTGGKNNTNSQQKRGNTPSGGAFSKHMVKKEPHQDSRKKHVSTPSSTSDKTHNTKEEMTNPAKVSSSSPSKDNKTAIQPGSEKLQKVLARAGLGSRREVEVLIQAGRVSIDGKIAHLGERVLITPDLKIRVDGKVIGIKEPEQEKCRIIIYYKPEGEICTRNDPEGRPTVYERLPKISHGRWIAVGRLDINTSGLLLFTNDGELANRLMHPSNEIEREYSVRVFGEVTDDKKRLVTRGVQLEDGPAAFKKLIASGGEGINQWYNVVLTEGRNREVRRIWEAVDLQVSRLIRIRYGNISLPTRLPRGGWQEMGMNDVNYLRELVQLPKESQGKINPAQDKKKLKTGQIRRAVQRYNKLSTATRKPRKI